MTRQLLTTSSAVGPCRARADALVTLLAINEEQKVRRGLSVSDWLAVSAASTTGPLLERAQWQHTHTHSHRECTHTDTEAHIERRLKWALVRRASEMARLTNMPRLALLHPKDTRRQQMVVLVVGGWMGHSHSGSARGSAAGSADVLVVVALFVSLLKRTWEAT